MTTSASVLPSPARPVLADLVSPGVAPGMRRRARDLGLVLAGSLLVALCARVEILLPFLSPVPITGQTFGVLLVAAALGRVRGTAALLAYLAEGAAGLPVFAGGAAGVHHLFGWTGGYLFAFVPAAWIVGALAERGWDRSALRTVLAMSLGTAVILLVGAAWLLLWFEPKIALLQGIVPFLPGAAVKIALAALALPIAWRLVGRRDRRG